MKFRARCTLTALSAVSVLVFAACGGGGDESSDSAEGFVAEADAVCTQQAVDIGALYAEFGTIGERAQLQGQIVPIREASQEKLAALEPPADDADAWERFVTAREQAVEANRKALAALEADDEEGSTAAFEEFDAAYVDGDAAAEEIGLKACAGILPDDQVAEVKRVIEDGITAGTAEELEPVCNEQSTDAFIEGLGGIEQCLTPGPSADSVEIREVTGISEVQAGADVLPSGGPFDATLVRFELVFEDGAWKVDGIFQALGE